jgi:hypothetical protein
MTARHTVRSGRRGEVVCIACGDAVPRSEAREYDKHGDRFDRDGKEFEFLCKPCYTEYSHLPRGNLEATLVEAGAGTADDRTFLRAYVDLVRGE